MKIKKFELKTVEGTQNIETIDELVFEQVRKFCITEPLFAFEFEFQGIPVIE